MIYAAICVGLFAALALYSVRQVRIGREAVLELLQDAPPEGMYGLDLVKASDGRLKRGTVYVILSRLQDEGLVRRVEMVAPAMVGLITRARYHLAQK